MKQTLTINQSEMLEIFKQIEKSTFINLTTKTKVRMNKTGNPYYDQVFKLSKSNFLVGNDYETRVQRNEQKEGLEPDFKSEECKVGVHISKCVLFNEKTNTHYLMVERFDEIKPQVEYVFQNNPIDKVLFESFMTKVYESKKQEQERKVMVITYKMESISEFSLNGNHYIVQ